MRDRMGRTERTTVPPGIRPAATGEAEAEGKSEAGRKEASETVSVEDGFSVAAKCLIVDLMWVALGLLVFLGGTCAFGLATAALVKSAQNALGTVVFVAGYVAALWGYYAILRLVEKCIDRYFLGENV